MWSHVSNILKLKDSKMCDLIIGRIRKCSEKNANWKGNLESIMSFRQLDDPRILAEGKEDSCINKLGGFIETRVEKYEDEAGLERHPHENEILLL